MLNGFYKTFFTSFSNCFLKKRIFFYKYITKYNNKSSYYITGKQLTLSDTERDFKYNSQMEESSHRCNKQSKPNNWSFVWS